MRPKRTLEVPIPDQVEVTASDLELLKATFQALVTLRAEKSPAWERLVSQMEADGWKVRWGLTWRAEAKRGEDYEEATGTTLEEALSSVAQLVMTDMVGFRP
ncbi:MAG: hypothetical protein IT186_08290 [Acidobacteria bacterium]|nr:hypothetical protein [Acidobacteriota bacterium]MCG3193137.1 hypothetical protein [Thermoanaerobaculia bacterium]MCK6684290.1 hypothetical protein [Thermoanaerobaculia bacterium]